MVVVWRSTSFNLFTSSAGRRRSRLEMAATPEQRKTHLIVRLREVDPSRGETPTCCSSYDDDGDRKSIRRAIWLHGFVLLLMASWIVYAHAQLLAYERKLDRVRRHVTELRKNVRRLRLNAGYGVAVREYEPSNFVDHVNTRRMNEVILSRNKRAGHHSSYVDDKLQTKPDDEDDRDLKIKQKQQCSPPTSPKEAENICHRSLKLVSDVKRYLIAVIKRTNIIINRRTSVCQHPSIHLAAISRADQHLIYLAWNTSNAMSHVTGSDGSITGRDQAFTLDGTRELVNITESGRYLVYAQVTFMGRNISKDSLETLDCGFRIVIARSVRYKTNAIGLFSAQTTQYDLGRMRQVYIQDSAYVSGVYVFQPGDELAIDVDRGVNKHDICRLNYDAAKTFFGIVRLGSTDPD